MTSVDPTAIPIEFDPREQRMRGTAYWGNTPFDVPWISQVAPNLWTGGCKDGLILPPHIEHVISLYPWEAYRSRHELKSNMAVWMYDSDDELDMDMLNGIAGWVNICRRTAPTLLHCQAGLNRSGLVASLALMQSGFTARGALAILREKRSPAVLCNPHFEKALLAL